ncbi:hypothetical protein D9M68_768540 [compost metagenome]
MARVERIKVIPSFRPAQFGKEYAIRGTTHGGGDAVRRGHAPGAGPVDHVDAIRVMRQLQLVYVFDREDPLAHGHPFDEAAGKRRLTRPCLARHDDIAAALNGQLQEIAHLALR